MKYGFIGCGNMGGALATAIAKTTTDIMLADYSQEKAIALADKLGCSYGTNEEIIQCCDRIFLGVKPQVMGDMLSSLSSLLQEKKPTLITMAAGLSLEKIETLAGGNLPVIRIMPNTPVAVGKGMVLHCKNALVSDETIADFVTDMRYAGTLDALDEDLIDAGCSLSGCGPAFMYMYIEALAKGATECGLPFEKAIKYAAVTMEGAARLALSSDKTPEVLRQEVCSPGGSTIQGVISLEKSSFREDAADAIKKAYKRNKELSEC